MYLNIFISKAIRDIDIVQMIKIVNKLFNKIIKVDIEKDLKRQE